MIISILEEILGNVALLGGLMAAAVSCATIEARRHEAREKREEAHRAARERIVKAEERKAFFREIA